MQVTARKSHRLYYKKGITRWITHQNRKQKIRKKRKIVRGPRLNQKLKIMYLMKILLEETDEDHDLTLNEIVEKLKAYNVTAERKSLYSDIENLRTFGLDIIGMQYGKTYHYKVASGNSSLSS